MEKIFFFSADKPVNIKNRKAVRYLIVILFNKEKIHLENLNYIFCSDEYLLNINQEYLKHDTLTDVITFLFSDTDKPISGEVYISVERIKENAKTYNVPYQRELLRVMIHGALHLCGYSDKKKFSQQEMRAKEDYYLNQFKVSREATT